MRTLHTLLVMTEKTRTALRPLLSRHPEIRVVAELASICDARAAVEMLSVDLVLLEVALPGEDGFDVLPAVPPDAHVICLTRDLPEVRTAVARGLYFVPLPAAPSVLADVLASVRSSPAMTALCLA